MYQPLGWQHHILWTPESLGVVNYGPATGLLVYRSRRVTFNHGVTSRYWNSDPFDPQKVYGVFCHSAEDEAINPDAANGELAFRQILERYRDMDTGHILLSLCESLGYPFDTENFHRTVIPR